MDTAHLTLARKLLEIFSYQRRGGMAFDRYWPLVGPVETFAEQAVGALEQDVAKALQMALEEVLKKAAPSCVTEDARAVATHLGVKPWTMRPYRPRKH